MINYYINLEIVAKSSNANSFFLLFHADNFYEGGGKKELIKQKIKYQMEKRTSLDNILLGIFGIWLLEIAFN